MSLWRTRHRCIKLLPGGNAAVMGEGFTGSLNGRQRLRATLICLSAYAGPVSLSSAFSNMVKLVSIVIHYLLFVCLSTETRPFVYSGDDI